MDHRRTASYSALGVVLVSLWISEIDQDAVAHVLRHEAVEAAYRFSHAFLIGRDYLAEVLRVHASGQRRRTHQVREHDGDLTALGGVLGSFAGCRGSIG